MKDVKCYTKSKNIEEFFEKDEEIK